MSQEYINQFNNSLPVEIEVLKKIDYIRYLLKLGRKELSTKSYRDLEIGSKYLAQLSNNQEEAITLSNMQKIPQFLQTDLALKVEFTILKSILSNKLPITFFKKSIIDALKESNNKNEFKFLIKLLLSLEQNILTIPFIISNTLAIIYLLHLVSSQFSNVQGFFQHTE